MPRRSRPWLPTTGAGRGAAGATLALALALAVALAILWPQGAAPGPASPASQSARATVSSAASDGCEAYAGAGCSVLRIDLLDGPNAGRRSSLTLGDPRFAPPIAVGDTIQVSRSGANPSRVGGDDLSDPSASPYGFVDFDRRLPLGLLAIAFALLVVVLASWQGVRALIGLGLSLAIVVTFIAPAILQGGSPMLVALVGSLAVMMVTMALTHGVGIKSQAAMLSTAVILVGITAVGSVAIAGAKISGFSDETALLLQSAQDRTLSVQGLVLAGLVIGALGVLDDVTISQSSTVLALRRVDPTLGVTRLTREALAVGRDHLGATVNTLVLAYAGASLPALLIFSSQGVGFGAAINFESVAGPVVAMLVGSIGLIAAVPLTTVLAATLAVRLPPGSIPAGEPHVH